MQGDIQKIAGAAGRVEHAEGGEAIQEGVADLFGPSPRGSTPPHDGRQVRLRSADRLPGAARKPLRPDIVEEFEVLGLARLSRLAAQQRFGVGFRKGGSQALEHRPAVAVGLGDLGHRDRDRDPRLVPFGDQWAHHHRLDDLQDLLAIGVVGAERGAAAGGLERLLEHRAEHRRIDVRPVVLRRSLGEQFEVVALQRQGVRRIEQAAVEPAHHVGPVEPAGAHLGEELVELALGVVRPQMRRLQRAGEQPFRQDLGVFRRTCRRSAG